MKPNELKEQFILKRAEGKSYRTIAQELNISKTTCSEWERELKSQITDKRTERLEALYSAYYMTKEARIEALGLSLGKIEEALERTDIAGESPAKLLELKLKYGEALKAEYIPIDERDALPENATPRDIYKALVDLANRVKAGEVGKEQAQQEQSALTTLLKAYDSIETQKRLDQLEAVLKGSARNG